MCHDEHQRVQSSDTVERGYIALRAIQWHELLEITLQRKRQKYLADVGPIMIAERRCDRQNDHRSKQEAAIKIKINL